jgi:hypothetical protein
MGDGVFGHDCFFPIFSTKTSKLFQKLNFKQAYFLKVRLFGLVKKSLRKWEQKKTMENIYSHR